MKKNRNINLIVNNDLCVGCGLCASVCSQKSISIHWNRGQRWIPKIDGRECTNCGLCFKICPCTPECIGEYVTSMADAGEYFGLPKTAQYFVVYDLNIEGRLRSASGGGLTVVLKHLLLSGKINGVLAPVPIHSPISRPHYELRVISSVEELDKARSSHYYPLCYEKALKQIEADGGLYAITGLPCIIRGIKRLPAKFRSRILYTFSLVCSHNVTGRFLDCLAKQEGVREGEAFISNLRDKFGGIRDANNYNNYFKLSNREIRRNRFQTGFTKMWRNYFFAQESCLYCPDFFGADSDLSVKDAWGRLSSDPLGISLLIVRNPELVSVLNELKEHKKIFLEACDEEEIFQSQPQTARFKHVEILDRLVWKSVIYRKLKDTCLSGTSRRLWKRKTIGYWRIRMMIFLSDFFYSYFGKVPVRMILKADGLTSKVATLLLNRVLRITALIRKGTRFILKKVLSLTRTIMRFFGPMKYVVMAFLRYPISSRPVANKSKGVSVLLAGGYGYQNVGDEAQLGAAISHWRRWCPNVRITILSPNPDYSEKLHGEHSEAAPRVTLFDANKSADYASSNFCFRQKFRWIKPRMLLLARLYLKGLPLIGVYPHEIRLLNLIAEADVLHLSGGGYLTGMTLSRLWDNMLLIRLADILGTAVLLSGQTIGIFKDKRSRKLARWGLEKAKLIYLRDDIGSVTDIRSLGIEGKHIKVTFDDALFCEMADEKSIDEYLRRNRIGEGLSYIAVNTHYFRQKPAESRQVMRRIAELCDIIFSKHSVQVLFIPLHPTDLDSMKEIQGNMVSESVIVDYDFDYRVAKGIISRAELLLTMKHHGIVFAMGTATPAIAIALDDYYSRKNLGTLGLFGQEQWLVGREHLFLSGFMEEMIDRCFREIGKQKSVIVSRLATMRHQDGEAIRRFRDEYIPQNYES